MTQTSYLLRRKSLGKTSCAGIRDASQTGIRVFRNDGKEQTSQGYLDNPYPNADIVFRWGCTSTISGNPKVINKAEAIHLSSNKAEFRMRCAVEGLAQTTYLSLVGLLQSNLSLEDGWVVRPRTHAQGKNLFVCRTEQELEDACFNKCSDSYYISKLIDKVAEFRVFVCSGRAVWVANKIPGNPDQVAWNVAQGGRFENVGWNSWNSNVILAAIKAWEISGLDFGGVDVMVDADGKAYVLEINSAPSQTSPYRQGCVAKAFDYIVQNGNQRIPLGVLNSGYRRFIHPALDSLAIVG